MDQDVGRGHGRRVLLVEDEPNITEAIRFLLSREGWQVEAHADGATAMDEISRLTPDLLILDMLIAVFTSIHFCRKL